MPWPCALCIMTAATAELEPQHEQLEDGQKPFAELGTFFAAKRRLRLAPLKSGPCHALHDLSICCQLCKENISVPYTQGIESKQVCEACQRREAAWSRIRCWVCLHVLVGDQRAFPLCESVVPESLEPCAMWDEDDAADRAIIFQFARSATDENGDRAASTFGYLSANLVRLPLPLLAQILELAHNGVRQIFAPAHVRRDLAKRVTEDKRRTRECTQRLLTSGSCLHGQALSASRSRQDGTLRCRGYVCWYCPQTFMCGEGAQVDSRAAAAEALEKHGAEEHAGAIAAWIRKKRKTKARNDRAWASAMPRRS